VVWLSVISAVLLIPTAALAWFCGTGRMTGGGKLVSVLDNNGTPTDVTATNGYELHCDGSSPNNLEVNLHDPSQGHFHLDTLQTTNCFTDPNFNSSQPAAGFNTFQGVGIGTWDNVTPACAEWSFVDGQGSAQNNFSYIKITSLDFDSSTIDICPAVGGTNTVPGSCRGTTTFVLVPFQTPLKGQNQAHQ
jgi:hypothetical protein